MDLNPGFSGFNQDPCFWDLYGSCHLVATCWGSLVGFGKLQGARGDVNNGIKQINNGEKTKEKKF